MKSMCELGLLINYLEHFMCSFVCLFLGALCLLLGQCGLLSEGFNFPGGFWVCYLWNYVCDLGLVVCYLWSSV